MTALEKCIEWMRGGGETPRSILLHQKIAKQATAELQDFQFGAAKTKATENENKTLKAENDQLRQQLKKNIGVLNSTKELLEHKK